MQFWEISVDAWDMARVVGRRWWVFLPLSLLTLLLTLNVDSRIKPEYQTSVTLLLVGPSETVPQVDDRIVKSINPYLNQGISTTASVMKVVLESPDSRRKVIEAGGSSAYSVGVQTRTPIMRIQIATRDRELTVKTAAVVADLLRDELKARQEAFNAPQASHITTQTLDAVGSVGEVRNGLKQIRVVILALGLGIATAATLMVNAMLAWLLRRRKDKVRLAAETGFVNDKHKPRSTSVG